MKITICLLGLAASAAAFPTVNSENNATASNEHNATTTSEKNGTETDERQGPFGPGGPGGFGGPFEGPFGGLGGPGGPGGPGGFDHHHHWDDENPEFQDPDGQGLSDRAARVIAATWLYFSVNIDRTIASLLLDPAFTLYSDSDNVAGTTGVCPPDLISLPNANPSKRSSKQLVFLLTPRRWTTLGTSRQPSSSMASLVVASLEEVSPLPNETRSKHQFQTHTLSST